MSDGKWSIHENLYGFSCHICGGKYPGDFEKYLRIDRKSICGMCVLAGIESGYLKLIVDEQGRDYLTEERPFTPRQRPEGG